MPDIQKMRDFVDLMLLSDQRATIGFDEDRVCCSVKFSYDFIGRTWHLGSDVHAKLGDYYLTRTKRSGEINTS